MKYGLDTRGEKKRDTSLLWWPQTATRSCEASTHEGAPAPEVARNLSRFVTKITSFTHPVDVWNLPAYTAPFLSTVTSH